MNKGSIVEAVLQRLIALGRVANNRYINYLLYFYCNNGSAILSNVFGHNNQIDICLSISATFQRILKFVACFRCKLA